MKMMHANFFMPQISEDIWLKLFSQANACHCARIGRSKCKLNVLFKLNYRQGS